MEIIKNNHTEKPSWNIVCPHCDSILKYNKDDVHSHESLFFFLHYIECPCCNKDVDVIHW